MAAESNHSEPGTALCWALCDRISEGAAIMNAATRQFIYCNAPFRKLFGYVDNTQCQPDLYRKLRKHPLNDEAISQREKTVKEKGSFTELAEYSPLTGHSFFGELHMSYLQSAGAAYYLFIIAAADKAFFELVSPGILLINKEGIIVAANPFICRQFGYEKQELTGEKIELLIPQRFHQTHVQHRQAFAGKPADRYSGSVGDLWAVRKNGTEFPVEITLGHYPSNGDQYVIAFVSDISVRKMAEAASKKLHAELESKVSERTSTLRETMEQLERSTAELQQANLFQKALFDSAGVMIVSVDNNGIIQSFNPDAEKELGYTAAELIGVHTPLLYHDPQQIATRAKELSIELHHEVSPGMNLFFEKAILGLQNENEWLYLRKDGSKFPVRLNVTAMKDLQDQITGYVGIAIDISATKKIEQELKTALQKEKELGELKSRFVTMASHEFRTPLSTVLSSAYLIEKYHSTEDQAKREIHLQRIVSSVGMLTDILNDFLSVGRMEEGKIQVRNSRFNLQHLLQEIIAGMESTLKPGQQIIYQHEGDSEIILDASLLKHIVINLLSNASKFSGNQSPIELSTSCNNESIAIAVKDHGIGISAGDQQHLMERFFRGANAGNIQGTGLGLHIVAKYTELMNGTITCRSELDKGTEFIIAFKPLNH